MRRSLSPFLIVMLLAATMAAQSIPSGKRITVRLGSELSSGKASVGQGFEGTLANDIVENGRTLAKSGSTVHGKVTYVKPSGRLHKPGVITVRLTSVNGIPVHTSAVTRQAGSHTKGNAEKIGGGAAAGALLGGVIGGGKG